MLDAFLFLYMQRLKYAKLLMLHFSVCNQSQGIWKCFLLPACNFQISLRYFSLKFP